MSRLVPNTDYQQKYAFFIMKGVNNPIYIYNMSLSSSTPGILISYSGRVDSKAITTLLAKAETILEMYKCKPEYSQKVLNIMIELLQNIVDHTPPEALVDEAQPSTFLFEKTKNRFTVSTTNTMFTRKTALLKKRIEYLNSLTPGEMTALVKDIGKTANPALETSGLGLIEIIREAGSPILFKFEPAGNNFSLFSVKVLVR